MPVSLMGSKAMFYSLLHDIVKQKTFFFGYTEQNHEINIYSEDYNREWTIDPFTCIAR